MAWLLVWLNAVKTCDSQLLRLPGATLASGDQLKKFASVCEDTGRPGDPGASCWVEPMSKVNSWRALRCVCACLHAHRAVGLQALRICQQLRRPALAPGHGASCRMAGLGH